MPVVASNVPGLPYVSPFVSLARRGPADYSSRGRPTTLIRSLLPLSTRSTHPGFCSCQLPTTTTTAHHHHQHDLLYPTINTCLLSRMMLTTSFGMDILIAVY
ncbi:hypothetical protein BDQ17DRAFT_1432008 [Cyathus striatus]|nr:hypothetical protein BDQ17DRAFT_1432008 [Cyathus striatus]